MTTFGEKVRAFNSSLDASKLVLPAGVAAMNPFTGENAALINRVTKQFYGRFYSDSEPRNVILGINPGRHGAGLTGTPFTDTKRLASECGIEVSEISSHEVSSVFVYEVINAMGGPKAFYRHFYIGNVCPLGFLTQSNTGRMVNYNYYDNAALQKATTPFIIQSIENQLNFGLQRDVAFVMGKGKNFKFVQKLNKQHGWFKELVPLDHPRYVMQYKTKLKQQYINEYVQLLGKALKTTEY